MFLCDLHGKCLFQLHCHQGRQLDRHIVWGLWAGLFELRCCSLWIAYLIECQNDSFGWREYLADRYGLPLIGPVTQLELIVLCCCGEWQL